MLGKNAMRIAGKERPYAIVLGLDSLQGIQAARILARRQLPVIALARRRDHPNCRTKVCQEILYADTHNEDLIATLETLGPNFTQRPVLFPCSDQIVLLISRHRKKLEKGYHVILPDPDVVELMADKISFYTYAKDEGFPIPEFFIVRTEFEAIEAAKRLNYPCILKPPRADPLWWEHIGVKGLKVTSPDELLVAYKRCKRWAKALIAQEWIEGKENNLVSCNCYFNADSEPVATFVARKLRQWPPGVGISCLGEEIRNDLVLREAVRLFRSVRHQGLGYVEMKRDERSGRYYIVEPNIGRPTGRSAIAEAGGVELLHTMYCDAVGLPLPKNLEQNYEGVKWIRLRTDLQSAFHYWRRGELTLKDWWKSLRGKKVYALFSWSDPGPFLGDLQIAIRNSFRSRERKKRRIGTRAKISLNYDNVFSIPIWLVKVIVERLIAGGKLLRKILAYSK